MSRALRLLALAAGVRFVRLGNNTLGFSRTAWALKQLVALPHLASPRDSLATLASDVKVAGGSPYYANCLHESMFLWFLMRRRGLDSRLRIGVTMTDDVLEGHAWVELDGAVINDDTDVADHYAVFDEDPTGIVFT